MELGTVPNQGEGVPANSVASRFYDGQGNGRGDGSIHCVPPALKNAQSGLSCEWLTSRNSAALGEDGQPPRQIRVVFETQSIQG